MRIRIGKIPSSAKKTDTLGFSSASSGGATASRSAARFWRSVDLSLRSASESGDTCGGGARARASGLGGALEGRRRADADHRVQRVEDLVDEVLRDDDQLARVLAAPVAHDARGQRASDPARRWLHEGEGRRHREQQQHDAHAVSDRARDAGASSSEAMARKRSEMERFERSAATGECCCCDGAGDAAASTSSIGRLWRFWTC